MVKTEGRGKREEGRGNKNPPLLPPKGGGKKEYVIKSMVSAI
jgi:hypothetical protein